MHIKPASRDTNLLFRVAQTPRTDHIDLLPPCIDIRRYLCIVRSASVRPIGYANICGGGCRRLPCTKKYVPGPQITPRLEADAKSKLVTRDVQERGREIEGCIKQWMSFVKPNFERYVEPQRKVAGKTCPSNIAKAKLKGA